ncbi:MAG: class I SAM-dependent methyltransferase [Bacteroidia bacterium]
MTTATLDDLKDQQRNSWDRFSPGWKKWDEFVMGWLKPVGDKIIEKAELKEDYHLLDCATGTGEPGLTAASIVKKGKVTATDLSEKMVKIASDNARERRISNYEAKVCDTDDLPFEDDTFDAVISRFGIIFFADLQKDVNELVRVLKPGKKIAVSVWAEPAANPWASVPMGVLRAVLQLPPPPAGQPGIFRCAEEGCTKEIFKEAGLKNVEEITVTGTTIFDTAQDYWNYMKEIAAPIVTALDKAEDYQLKMIDEQLMNELKKYQNKDSGKLELPWKARVVAGTK